MARDKSATNRRVYSSEGGRLCPGCGRPADDCACRPVRDVPDVQGPVRVARETKGRKGKAVSVVTGLSLDAIELTEMARKLKQHCGAGGTVRDGAIEIQGDHRDQIVTVLRSLGYEAKRSGG